MRKVIVNEFMTLDGVVQSPSSPAGEQVLAQPMNARRTGRDEVALADQP